MAYAALTRGSSGSEVKKLQQSLVNAGYNIAVDGSYGPKTEAAVRQYQKANGLTVDGMAGQQTQTKLYGGTASAAATAAKPAASTPAKPAASYNPGADAAYQKAIAALQAVQKTTPTYAGTYDKQLADLYQQIVGRDKFQYDIDSDMLYQQYKQQYQDLGRTAMQDTIGQAAALTGGYGSSYAEQVGQQQYNAYLQRLNDVIPELYGQAYQRYKDEGDQMLQQYSMLGDLADTEYNRYQDAYSRWLAERDYAQGNADTAYNRGYQQWAAAVDQYNTDREYQLAVDKFAYQKQQDAKAAAAKGSTSSSSKRTPGRTTGTGYNNGSMSADNIKKMQAALGVKQDGKWGPATQAAAQKKWGTTSADAAWKSYSGGGGGGTSNYNLSELLDATGAGMSKSQIESILASRGVNVNSPAVQQDIKWALSK